MTELSEYSLFREKSVSHPATEHEGFKKTFFLLTGDNENRKPLGIEVQFAKRRMYVQDAFFFLVVLFYDSSRWRLSGPKQRCGSGT